MTSNVVLRPNGVKLNSWNANYSRVSDQNNGTYNECGDSDDNKRNEYYMSNMPSTAYAIDSYALGSYCRGVGATIDGTTSLHSSTGTEWSSMTGSYSTSGMLKYAAQSLTNRSVGDMNGCFLRMQPLSIGKDKGFRECEHYASVYYWTKSEAKPTVAISSSSVYSGASFTSSYSSAPYSSKSDFITTNNSSYSSGTSAWNRSAGDVVRCRSYQTYGGVNSDYGYSSTVTIVQPSSPSFSTSTQTVYTSPQTISWNAVDLGGTEYYYLECSYNGGAYSQIYSGTGLSYSHTLGDGYGTYTYRVRCNYNGNTNNYSNYSSTITLTYAEPAYTVEGMAVTTVDGMSFSTVEGK